MTKEELLKKAYVERDISWMYFNHRILQEAEKEYVPLLERLSFLGIYSNNLDEFFRVRVVKEIPLYLVVSFKPPTPTYIITQYVSTSTRYYLTSP